jgi:exodeoxyribonuclease VII small subunit
MSESAEDLTFEQALARLEVVVRDLESSETGLDKALERYEDGVRVLKRCRAILDEAERKIRLLTRLDANGGPVTESFDASQAAPCDTSENREPSAPPQRTTARATRRVTNEPAGRGEQLF